MDLLTIVFVVVGILLIASEVVAPALFSVFLGIAALLTAGLRMLGVVDGLPASLLVFAVTSVATLVPGRFLINRLMPGRSSERRKDAVDVEHDRDEMGVVVDVVEDVGDDHDLGRVRFQGTTWQARAVDGTIKAGSKAQLVYREGSLWIVEQVVVDGGARDLFTRGSDVDADVDVDAAVDLKRDS